MLLRMMEYTLDILQSIQVNATFICIISIKLKIVQKNKSDTTKIITGTGRYSVKCEVVGDDDTQINEGFITSR